MVNKFVAAALLSFGVVTMVSSTEAAQLISSYTDVEKCPIPFERDDEFIFECTGPGGVKAVLYYVEGKVEIYYDEGGRTIGTHAGIIELSTRAPRAFGQKHEWRMKKGGRKPCAAIIRVYAAEGERLVVADLSGTGGRLGLVKTNNQARALADKACR